MSRTPSRRRSLSSPADTRLPSPAAFPGRTRQGPRSLGWLWRLELQHPALWGGPRAGARCALAGGNPRGSTIALSPPAPFTDANTLKPASTPQARQHFQGERPFQQPGPVQTGCALLPKAPPPSRQWRSSPPPAQAPPLLEGAEMDALSRLVWKQSERNAGFRSRGPRANRGICSHVPGSGNSRGWTSRGLNSGRSSRHRAARNARNG